MPHFGDTPSASGCIQCERQFSGTPSCLGSTSTWAAFSCSRSRSFWLTSSFQFWGSCWWVTASRQTPLLPTSNPCYHNGAIPLNARVPMVQTGAPWASHTPPDSSRRVGHQAKSGQPGLGGLVCSPNDRTTESAGEWVGE